MTTTSTPRKNHSLINQELAPLKTWNSDKPEKIVWSIDGLYICAIGTYTEWSPTYQCYKANIRIRGVGCKSAKFYDMYLTLNYGATQEEILKAIKQNLKNVVLR